MDNSESARGTSYPALMLDLSEPHYRTLADYARGIRDLLSKPAAGSSPELAGSIDDLLGAVYALIQAKRHHFKDRDRPINIKPVAQRAGRIASGHVRTDGQWIAGFYFNNALFRTASVYHRLLKIVTGKNAYVPVLLPKVKALYPSWANDKLDLVHGQVNHLKHTPRGVHDERTVKYDDAVAAVGELIALIQAATAQVAPSSKP
jgi:hypothetical protein